MSFRKSECGTDQPSPLKVVFHQYLSSTEGYLQPNVIFHRNVIHQRMSYTEGFLPPKGVLQSWTISSDHLDKIDTAGKSFNFLGQTKEKKIKKPYIDEASVIKIN